MYTDGNPQNLKLFLVLSVSIGVNPWLHCYFFIAGCFAVTYVSQSS